VTRAAVLLVVLAAVLAGPSGAAAQDPPPCSPEKTMDAQLIAEEDGEFKRLVATHEVLLTAEVHDLDAPISRSPDRIVITPQAGVRVIGKYSGGSDIAIIAPATPTLTAVVSWRQTTDPDDYDVTDRCSASKAITLPVTAANPARGVRQPNPGPEIGEITFAIAPALRNPNLSPLEITIRSTGQVRYPRANERLVTWNVPMRVVDQLKYRTRLPNLAYATFPQKCRFWWLTCGPVNADVAQLNVNERGRPDLDGSNAILRTLARSQPARWAAEFGLVVTAFPGAAANRPFGFDVQVKQDGRLLARARRAGRCREITRSTGSFHSCDIKRVSTLLR
jgi:hypothetical protein